MHGGEDGVAVAISEARGGALIEVLAAGRIDDAMIEQCIEAGRGLCGLDDDPADFAEVAQRHPLTARLHRRYAGARMRTLPTVWESFASSVIEQLVTSTEAMFAIRRLHRRHGEEITGSGLRAFPTARVVARLTSWELRVMGVGLRRATTLLRGAQLGDRLEALRTLPPEEAMRWLEELRGIGPWTANKVAMESLGYADSVLVGDAGVPRMITAALSGRDGGDDEMLEDLAPFRPHRARVLRLLELKDRSGGGGHIGEWSTPRNVRRKPPIDPHRRYPWRF